ncbi:hypothetical protein LK09_01165 [Microbacterium mangrovi]|uniref:HNH nuclease domain-containing protein n=2 Tax=Microbacterium mangrovi TaxID=1348253 RepID=A0A0B2AEF5_9MICO|nr:hypothetical protein LK09_01165 [Microbacterium mangrovi]
MMSVIDSRRVQQIDLLRRESYARAAADGLTNRDLVDRSVRLELAAAMGVTEHTAGMLMARGEALVHRYPVAFSSLEAGRMSVKHSEILVTLLDGVDPELRDALIDPAVALAETEPVGVFRRTLRALIEKVQQPTLTERHDTALQHRRVQYEAGADGMAWLGLYGPAVELKAGFERLTRIGKTILHAQPDPDQSSEKDAGRDERTLDQVRADVLGDLLIEGVAPAHPKAARGIRAEVVVTVPALSLLDDEHAAAAEPAHVEGVGPVPIEVARRLAGGSRDWMRVLTHPETGIILSVGRKKYRPPKQLRQLVKWRAGRCLAPGCNVPADRCDIDHGLDWAKGGETRLTNLNPFCKGHHIVKHGTAWCTRQQPDGSVQWTSPLGRVYTVPPERTLPTFTTTSAPF